MKRIFLLLMLCVSFIFTNMVFANNNKMSIKVLQNGVYSDIGINESDVISYSLSVDTLELKLNKTGKQKLAEATKNNVGQKMAVIYKDVVITENTIREPITTGDLLISGNDEALADLADVFDSFGVSDKQANKKLILPISIAISGLLLLFGMFKVFTSEMFKRVFKNTIHTVCKPIYVTSLISVCALGGVGYGIYKVIEVNSLPTCDSNYVVNQVIEVQKANSPGYKEIQQYVANLDVEMPRAKKYDKEISKYECVGRFVITFTEPLNEGGEPAYADSGRYIPKFYNKAICDVEYSVEKSKGKTLVFSNYCHHGHRYTMID